MSVNIIGAVLHDLEAYVERLPVVAQQAARIAINDTITRKGRKLLIQEMEKQTLFPPNYINDERLFLRSKATDSNLEAVLIGRQRPTSLARFSSGGAIGQRGLPIRIQVARGGVGRTTKRAFLLRLNSGRGVTEDRFNIGLALRVPEGTTLTGRKANNAKQIFPNVYLLYGPSVDQVFRDVAGDKADELGEMVRSEFLRQFDRLLDAAP